MNEFEKNYERLDDFHPHHHHADMNAWAELHRKIPDDIDEPIVVHYESGTSVVNSAIKNLTIWMTIMVVYSIHNFLNK